MAVLHCGGCVEGTNSGFREIERERAHTHTHTNTYHKHTHKEIERDTQTIAGERRL